MSLRTILAVLLALVCGVSAAFGVNLLRKPGDAAKPDTVPIVVAAVDVPRAAMVTAEYLTTQEWPKDLIPPGAILKTEDALDRAVLSQLVKGEPILDAKLASRDAGRGMAPLVPRGMRAYSITTRGDASGVAGFVLPGNHVDVMLTVTDVGQDDKTGGGSTSTLLQNIPILAVNQELEAPSSNKVGENLKSVTLLVTPEQAAMLSLAQTKGTLHLSLRNDEDKVAAETNPVLMKQLRFTEEAPAELAETPAPVQEVVAAPPAPDPEPVKPLRIRTLRGNSVSIVYVHPGEYRPQP